MITRKTGKLDGNKEVSYYVIEGQKINGVWKPTSKELGVKPAYTNADTTNVLAQIRFNRCLIWFTQLATYRAGKFDMEFERDGRMEVIQAKTMYFDGCVVISNLDNYSYCLGRFEARNTVFIGGDEAVFVLAGHDGLSNCNKVTRSVAPSMASWMSEPRRDWGIGPPVNVMEIRSMPQLRPISALIEADKPVGVGALWMAWYEGDPAAHLSVLFDLRKEEFDVVLTSCPGKAKLAVIAVLTLGSIARDFEVAKAAVDNLPVRVAHQLPWDEASRIKSMLQDAGATVEIQHAGHAVRLSDVITNKSDEQLAAACISVIAQQQTLFKSIVPEWPFDLPYASGA